LKRIPILILCLGGQGASVLSRTFNVCGMSFGNEKTYWQPEFLFPLGMGTIIMPGVTIGEGVSVGAGSLVTKDLPDWTICYGSPCRPMKDKPREKQLQMEKEFLEEYNRKKEENK